MLHRLRPCRPDEAGRILAIVNAAAQAYRGVIPDDCWHEPYMAADYLDREIAADVTFWGCEIDGDLAGVMGVQGVRDVTLIRHAYIAPEHQGRGVGGALLEHLKAQADGPMLVGAWAAAHWAIRFYQQHGFCVVGREEKTRLLQTYWTISPRQIETSVVLAGETFQA